MRALIFCFAACLSLSSLPASAQGLHCAPRAQVLDLLSRQDQTRRAMGQAGPAVMELFAAQDSQHWTLTVTLRDGRMCRLAHGVGYEARDEAFPPPGRAL